MSFMTVRRGRAAAVTAGLLALLVPTTAHAITNGTPTGAGRYANVGSFVVEIADGSGGTDLLQLCTGTVIAPRVVLTASHCMDRAGYPGDWGKVWFTLEHQIGDGKSWTLREDMELLDGKPLSHPAYTGKANYRYDVGAFILDRAVSLPSYPELAPAGYLDDRSLRGSMFTAVGYGIERQEKEKSTSAFTPPTQRMMSTQPLVNVHRDYVLFSMSLARGFGGTCYGDSGGPKFSSDGDIVAVVTTGDIPCKATDQATRTDTPYAQEFVANLLADPDHYDDVT